MVFLITLFLFLIMPFYQPLNGEYPCKDLELKEGVYLSLVRHDSGRVFVFIGEARCGP